MLKPLAAALLAVTALASAARADAVTEGDSKSELTATALSVGGTAAGAGLLALGLASGDYRSQLHAECPELVAAGAIGLALGPSLGGIYAHDVSWSHVALRVAGGAGVVAGVWMFADGILFSPATAGAGVILVGGGAAAVIAGTALDLWGAHGAARDFNRHHLAVAPMVAPHGGTGLALAGTF